MFKLAVKLEGIERRKRTTSWLHAAAGFYLLVKSFDYFRLQHGQHLLWVWLYVAAGFVSLLYGVLKKLRDPNARFNPAIRLLQVCVFTLLAIDFIPFESRTLDVMLLFTWAVGCLLLLFTERKVYNDAEMVFAKEGIFIPGYFSNRRLFWNNISEVVVRPDYITIFQGNERYLQYEVLKNTHPSALDEIALYCREQVLLATKAA